MSIPFRTTRGLRLSQEPIGDGLLASARFSEGRVCVAVSYMDHCSLHVSQPPLLGKNRREGRGGCDTGYVDRLRIRLAGLRTRGKLKKSQVRKPSGLHMHACNMQTEYVSIA